MKRISKLSFLSFAIISLFCLVSCNQNPNVFSEQSKIILKDEETTIGEISGNKGSKIDGKNLTKLTSYQSKDNTTFKGWYSDIDYTKKVNIKYYPMEDEKIFYGFFANHVSISLEKSDNDASYPSSENDIYFFEGVEGEEIDGEFPIPDKPGYSFSGWVNKDTGEKFSTKFYPSEDITLIPSFTLYPTISFVTNIESYQIPDVSIRPGDNILNTLIEKQIIDDSKLDKGEDFKFYGWSTSDEYTNTFNLDTTMPETSFTLYADFVSKRTIHFDTSIYDNDIYIDDITCFPGDSIQAPSLSSSTLLDTNFHYFISWYEHDENGEFLDTPFFENNHIMPKGDGDITLYPKLGDKYCVEIYDNDTLITFFYSKPEQTFNLMDVFIDNNLTISNYIEQQQLSNRHFNYFYFYDADDNVVPIDNYSNYQINSDLKIYLDFENYLDLTFSFEDPYDNSLSNLISNYQTKAFNTVSTDVETEINNYVNSTLNVTSPDLYKVTNQYYLNENNQKVYFNYPISCEINPSNSFACVISKKININYSLYIANIDTDETEFIASGTYSNYQNETILEDTISFTDSNIIIYGQSYNLENSKDYQLNLVKSESQIINLPTICPSEDLNIDIYISVIR